MTTPSQIGGGKTIRSEASDDSRYYPNHYDAFQDWLRTARPIDLNKLTHDAEIAIHALDTGAEGSPECKTTALRLLKLRIAVIQAQALNWPNPDTLFRWHLQQSKRYLSSLVCEETLPFANLTFIRDDEAPLLEELAVNYASGPTSIRLPYDLFGENDERTLVYDLFTHNACRVAATEGPGDFGAEITASPQTIASARRLKSDLERAEAAKRLLSTR